MNVQYVKTSYTIILYNLPPRNSILHFCATVAKHSPTIGEQYAITGECFPTVGKQYRMAKNKKVGIVWYSPMVLHCFPVVGEQYKIIGEQCATLGEQYKMVGEQYRIIARCFPAVVEGQNIGKKEGDTSITRLLLTF